MGLRSLSFPTLLVAVAVLSSCGFGPSEQAGLPQECVVPNATLAAAHTPIDLAMERAGQALLYQYPANRYALLTMPGCQVTPLSDVPGRVGLADVSILPGGSRLMAIMLQGQSRTEWWYIRSADSAPMRPELSTGPASDSGPILSADGEWVAWLRSKLDRENRVVELVLRRPDGKEEKTFRLTTLQPAFFDLLEVNVAAQELTVTRGTNAFLRVGFDGKILQDLRFEKDFVVQSTTFRRFGEGYFVWDAFHYTGHDRIGWSLPSEKGTYSFEFLREIQHAAVDPSGRYAAASLETQYGRALSLRDAISVIRLSDRQEIFRKYLPRFNRSQVAFLTARYFAYSDGNQVRVLRLPE
jgi:hypothetical protein